MSKFMVRARNWLGARANAFRRARKGNVAMIFALATIPILIAGGAGVDLARALAVRAKLYAAVDAAALAVAAKPGATLDQQKVLAQQYFNANYQLNPSFGAPMPVSVTVANSTVTVKTEVTMPTTLMAVAGIEHVPVKASSEVVWGQTKLWVALALDNTGSMCEPSSQPCPSPGSTTKMYALKAATKELLNILKNASATAGDVQAAIVPFAKDVNVGASNYNASWIDWTDWDAVNGSCSISGKSPKNTCESSTTGSCSISGNNSKNSCESAGTCSISGNNSKNSCESATSGSCSNPSQTTKNNCQNNNACSNAGYSTKNSCQNAGFTWGKGTWTTKNGVWTPGVWTSVSGVWTPNNHNTWNGCVADRGFSIYGSDGPDTTNNYDVMNTAPGSTAESKFPAEQWSSCPASLMTLSYDWSALNTKVDDMTANGNTNQTVGLAWAWHALSQGAPLNAGSVPANTTRYIILLSDGANTENRWSSSQSSIDTRMGKACANAKADNIIVYTLFLDVGGKSGNADVLKGCATGGEFGGNYFHLTNVNQVSTAFNLIGQKITNVRVAK
ncbi:MAG: pilus assembly protein TadG-related protein [Hyphomonadaceae bacterium]